jgi:hypothetical protein
VTLKVEYLTDERRPVNSSEFGSESFCLLNGRQLWLKLRYRLKSGPRGGHVRSA